MAGENLVNNNGDPAAATARLLMRRGLKAALATLERAMGDLMAQVEGMRDDTFQAVEQAARTAVGEEHVRFEPDPKLTSQYSERLEHYRVLQRALPPITQALQQKPQNGELGAA